MSQNIYDDPEFFARYRAFRRSVEGLDGAPEWPSLRGLLPAMRGLRVVDLGCGFGWFCRWAREAGAASVLGVDVSSNMLARAKAETSDPAITWLAADLETLDLPEAAFDLAYSSLALHYVAEIESPLARVRRALVPEGALLFSVEHPIFTAPMEPRWVSSADGRKTWPLDSYLIEGPRSTDWLVKGVIKRHRTFAGWLNLLLRLGFVIEHVEEWGPTDEQIAMLPALADERQRPTFLILSARRPRD